MRKLFGFVTLSALIAAVGISTEFGQMTRKRQARLERLERRIAELEQTRDELEEHAQALRSDPLAVEEALRRRFQFIRPGEHLLTWKMGPNQ